MLGSMHLYGIHANDESLYFLITKRNPWEITFVSIGLFLNKSQIKSKVENCVIVVYGGEYELYELCI